MQENNLIDHEFPDDLSTTIGRIGNLQICTEPCDIKDISYFKVYNRFNSSIYCRISMTEPKYIGADDEKFKLTRQDIYDLLYFLQDQTMDVKGNSLGVNNWEYLIEVNNTESVDPNMYIKTNLIMPDYEKLNPGV